MIELVQFPWSPFCIVQRRILEFAGVRFKVTNIPTGDRSLVWKLTRGRYYQVPVLRDGRSVLFELEEASQVIAKYLDDRFELGLFPRELRGVQTILWHYIERDIEDVAFRLNDIYWEEFVAEADRMPFLRHKERKFGRGCLDQWRAQQPTLLEDLEKRLIPFEQMLLEGPFLLGRRPRFADFDLFGMLGNFLYSGHYQLPALYPELAEWHARMTRVKLSDFAK
jgi:glutathione S-transferase